jgi:hypothetical protein
MMKTSILSKQNPLRFGGFCTTADSGVTLGFKNTNALKTKNQTGILYLKEKRNEIFSVIILDNNSSNPFKYKRFSYLDLK